LLGYTEGEEVAFIMEAFVPSKLIEAMVHYSNNSDSDSNLNRQSILSAETTITEESDCFSERESISSSVTSVDDVEGEGSNENGVQKMEKECEEVGIVTDESGISDESDGEDMFDGSGSCVREELMSAKALFSVLGYYFSQDMVEDDESTVKVRPEEDDSGNGVAKEARRADNSLERGTGNYPEVEGAELPAVQQAPILEALNTLEDEEPFELLYPVPDDETLTKSLDFGVPRPHRPVRESEEDLFELFDFMQKCHFALPDGSFFRKFGGYSVIFGNTSIN